MEKPWGSSAHNGTNSLESEQGIMSKMDITSLSPNSNKSADNMLDPSSSSSNSCHSGITNYGSDDGSSSSSIKRGDVVCRGAWRKSKPHTAHHKAWDVIRSFQSSGESENKAIGITGLKIVRCIGRGDIGSVYLTQFGKAPGPSCLFAMKVVDKQALWKRNKIWCVENERQILELLDHPFLPTLFAHFDNHNFSCLVTEFCPGGDLHTLQQKQCGKRFSFQVARFYAAEVVVALEYLHTLGVVYRDLKPENVLVREDGHLMLTDFDLSLKCETSPKLYKRYVSSTGIRRKDVNAGRHQMVRTMQRCWIDFLQSCLFCLFGKEGKRRGEDQVCVFPAEIVLEPSNAQSMSFVGTHEYLAPEIILGQGHGSAVDWWALGILVFEFLVGRTPFKGSSNEATLRNIIEQGLVFPEKIDVPQDARNLIERLLVKDPERRLGSAEVKRHPFFKGLYWPLIRETKPPLNLKPLNL